MGCKRACCIYRIKHEVFDLVAGYPECRYAPWNVWLVCIMFEYFAPYADAVQEYLYSVIVLIDCFLPVRNRERL